ncbi:putative ribosome biogenesis GTPase [Candidatus Protochlamydia naegleriophila]|uniref:Small ribosomal subunit biogenesis GTPase RsgA n=1 Tax=Candidatus Protochlamydia naegleriophila TaxID=389348 RepID=A0A0U5JAG4_9BACT|nr:ribosome small subunit-dependent GTPase A [Candidatus Protochlamydia naegleriophila]CUI15764.1 putative ribosome biogenesis GTPase [Candidatus Protochlamydia naegleriophila]
MSNPKDDSHWRDPEEDYFQARKESRMQRKLASAKDRSKFKKTDQEKYLKNLEKGHQQKLSKQEWLEGRVISIMPQGVIVDHEGERISCVLKGLMKRDKTQAKNLVAVGDFVLFERTHEGEGIIASVKPRRTILSRADNLSRRKEQLIAVNIDQVIITVSVVNPPLKPPLIDRYIIAAHKGNMEPLLVINKVDLLDHAEGVDEAFLEQEKALYQELLNAYAVAGVPVISVSAAENKGLDALRQAMQGKASVFSGQSGVGKSSLINAVTDLNLRVGETVERTKKGSHTTTTTQLIPLEFGGWCIDTPGIKSFGVWDLDKNEIEGYFPEIHECGLDCKFPDCTHSHEDNCAVQKALEEERISLVRYISYQALIQTINEKHVRR